MRYPLDWGKRFSDEIGPLAFPPRLNAYLWIQFASILPDFSFPSLRTQFYRFGGCKIAAAVALLGRVNLVGNGHITIRLRIGQGTIIAPGVTFGLDEEIRIGRNVAISPNTTLYTATHAIGFGSRRMNPIPISKPIVVEDGVWIGMNALILPGVTLGHGCVVSAGAVVSTDVPPDTLVAGNPAVVVQKLPFGNR